MYARSGLEFRLAHALQRMIRAAREADPLAELASFYAPPHLRGGVQEG